MEPEIGNSTVGQRADQIPAMEPGGEKPTPPKADVPILVPIAVAMVAILVLGTWWLWGMRPAVTKPAPSKEATAADKQAKALQSGRPCDGQAIPPGELPADIHIYPNGGAMGTISSSTNGGVLRVNFGFCTRDGSDKVYAYLLQNNIPWRMQDEEVLNYIKNASGTAQTVPVTGPNKTLIGEQGKGKISVNIVPVGSITQVLYGFSETE